MWCENHGFDTNSEERDRETHGAAKKFTRHDTKFRSGQYHIKIQIGQTLLLLENKYLIIGVNVFTKDFGKIYAENSSV